MKEIEFEQRVVDLAQTFGWWVAGFRPAQTKKGWRTPVKYDGKGYPDLSLFHGGQRTIIFAELKSDSPGAKRDDDQMMWGNLIEQIANQPAIDICEFRDEMSAPAIYYFTWYPKDWNTIVPLLTHGRGS